MPPLSFGNANQRRLFIYSGLTLTVMLLVGIGWLCWENMRAMIESGHMETHTHYVKEELDELLSSMRDAETGQRGYIITGDRAYLEPYQNALGQLDGHLATLKRLTHDNPNQQARLDKLEPVIRERLALIKRSIEFRASQGFQAAAEVIAEGRGKQLMDETRRLVAEAQGEEDRLLSARTAAREADTQKTARTLLIGGLFSLAVLLLVFFLLLRELAWRQQAERELLGHRNHLADLVDERTSELKEANEHLRTEARERRRADENMRRSITERKLAEEELRQSEEKYRAIVESATEYAIFTLDTGWRVRSWNSGAQHLLGYSEGEILGRSMDEIFTEEDCRRGVPETDRRDVMATGRTKNERWYRRKDGSRFYGIGIMVARHDSGGQLIGFLKILQDITERRMIEEELERRVAERTAELQESYQTLESLNAKLAASNRELQDFAFVASHDLQEPLRKVMAFGDMLVAQCGAALGETGTDYLRRMQSAAKRMQTLISDLLQFSRVTTKAQPFTRVELRQVAESVLSDLEVRLKQSAAEVELGDLPAIDADPTQMRQLLQNLIGNAVKFARPELPPRVRIHTEPEDAGGGEARGGRMRLFVQDNGIGFEEIYLDRIFTVFQRLHERGAYEGTGIGLAICRKIAERHGGSITARSRPGEGSTFIVTLPYRQTPGRNENGS